jgi:hypothetical protein
MAVLAAIAAFPVLTLLLIGLSKAETVLYTVPETGAERAAAEPVLGEVAVD